MNIQPISAIIKTKPISVTSTASSSTALPGFGNSLRVVNVGPSIAYISVGAGTQTATVPNATPTATSTPILAGSDVTFTIPDQRNTQNSSPSGTVTPLNISAICDSGNTATLYVSVGEGV